MNKRLYIIIVIAILLYGFALVMLDDAESAPSSNAYPPPPSATFVRSYELPTPTATALFADHHTTPTPDYTYVPLVEK